MHVFTIIVRANQITFLRLVQPQRILSNGGEGNAKNNVTNSEVRIIISSSRSKQQQTILVRFFQETAQRRGETGILKWRKKRTYNKVFSRITKYRYHAYLWAEIHPQLLVVHWYAAVAEVGDSQYCRLNSATDLYNAYESSTTRTLQPMREWMAALP